MIDFYTWTTPNGRKVSILLEELGIDYETHSINITQGDQNSPEFLKISPNNKIPAIVDRDNGLTLMESGAIMHYLAEKHGRFLPTDPAERARVNEWLMWQMGGFGPMLGQAHHFTLHAKEQSAYGKQRYYKEANRLYGVLDRRLAAHEFVAGQDLSIADIAIFPWTRTVWRQGVDLNDYPHVVRWRHMLINRPAFLAGVQIGASARTDTKDMTEQDWLDQFSGAVNAS